MNTFHILKGMAVSTKKIRFVCMRDYGLQETIWGFQRGRGGWGSLVMGIKEGTCWMEHWVLYANHESWNTTPKTNDVMYGD